MLLSKTSAVLRWTRFLLGLWHREYHDSRIILEQQGDLKYLTISARLQRDAARTGLVILGVLLALLLTSTATAAWLQTRKLMLENSHREIFVALQSAGINPDSQGGEYSQADMLEMARAIRERDMQIRQYVGDWTESLASRNAELRNLIGKSGLNDKVISLIQRSQPVGGSIDAIKGNPLLGSEFAAQTAVNKELRSVLEALPSRMPLDDFNVTSDFGIRNHPILNKPALHAGVDLTSASNDTVKSVKPGKVLVAGFHGNMGNTVLIRHANGIETLYGHLDRIFVKPGEEVPEGKPLGTVGNTGQSTGKHLHFEVLIGSYQVDPKKVIQTAQYVRKTEK